MRIKKINMYGYGKFENKEIHVSPHLQIFHGENEAGKSTIMSFIRHVLFGFPTKVHSENRYEPRMSTNYGGSLEIETETHGTVVIERLGKSPTGDVTVQLEGGIVGGDEKLAEILTGMNKELYQAIFSFDLEGLQKVSQLSEEKLGDYLLSASMTGTDVVRQVEMNLLKEQDLLYKPRGKKQTINEEIEAYNQVHEKYIAWQKKIREYDAFLEEKEELIERIAQLEQERGLLQRQSKENQQKHHLQPLLKKRQEFIAIQNEYADSADFLVDGVKRLDEIQAQMQPLKLQYQSFPNLQPSRLYREMEGLGIVAPENVQVNYLVKEECRQYSQQFPILQAQKDQLDQSFSVSKDELEKCEHHVRDLEEQLKMYLPNNRIGRKTPSQVEEKMRKTFPFFMIPSIIIFIVGIIMGEIFPIVSGSVFLVTFVVYYVVNYKGRQDEPSEEETKLRAMLELEEVKLRQAKHEFERVVEKFEDWEREMGVLEEQVANLKGKIRLTGQIPIGQLSYMIDKIEQVQVEYKQTQQERGKKAQVGQDIQLLREECRQLFAKARVSDEEQFRVMDKRKQQYDAADSQVIFINGQLGSIGSLDLLEKTDLHENYEMLVAEVEEKLAKVSAAERNIQNQLAEITANMKQMEEGSDYQSVLYQLELKKSSIKGLAKRWGAIVLAKELVRKTKEMYQKERLPQTFQVAEKYFCRLTGGEYPKLFLPKDNQIKVERKDGQLFLAMELSRGTAEQLYLALRLALASTYSGQKYPLILDDPFVNFDENRGKAAMELIAEISAERQVLLFTCHKHLGLLTERTESDGQVINAI